MMINDSATIFLEIYSCSYFFQPEAYRSTREYIVTSKKRWIKQRFGSEHFSINHKSTPILKGKEAVRFSEKIKKDLAKPAKLIPTPGIEEARRAVKEYAAKREK